MFVVKDYLRLRSSNFIAPVRTTLNMARKVAQNDQIVKLIVGAGQASPSPPVGPALGSKGVKSMDFCKVGLQQSSFRGLKLTVF